MTPNIASSVRASSAFPLLSAALAAVGAISTAQAQVQVAGALLINVDATAAPLGALAAITNSGTLGGFFEARFGTNVPAVVAVSGNGTRGMQFDGTDFLEHYNALGGTLVPADPSLTGVNPTTTIEAWVLNPGISAEETVVSWGHRGGTPDGSNMSFNYGWDDRWGAVGHWGGADIGWDPCCNSGSNPQGVPKSGVWHHLVYTFDGTTQRVYSDGILKNSENVALNIFPIPPVVIGAQMANDTVVEPGLRGTLTIGRLRIHSEALTGIQVANNYNLEEPDFSEGGSLLPSGPIHRYSFSNPSGSAGAATIQDLAGTAHGTVKGGGTTFTGSRLTLPGGASASAGYVDLPNGLLSTNGVANGGSGKITFEGWVKNTGTRNWGRVFDLGNGTAGEINDVGGDSEGRDYFFLSGTEGTNPQRHNTSIRNLIAPAGSDIGVGWDTANANRDYHFAVTWDEATGQVLSYENGALVSSITFNPATDTFSNIQDVNVWLGRSQWTGDENFQGEYDEFRIYDRVLPPDQVRQAYAAGPDLVPTTNGVSIVRQPQSLTIVELQSATFTVSLQGSPPVSLQWYRDGAAVAGANTNTLVVNSLLTADSGDQFFVVVSNFFDGIAYNLTSSIATLTVLSEVIPPVLLQGRANNTNRIELIFSEGLRPDEATNAANYGLTGTNAPPILGAALSPDATRVVLTLGGALTGCESYVVSASNVRDVAGNPIAVGSSVTFWYFPVEGMTHRYSFNNAPGDATGATVADVVGGANGVVLNGGGTTTFTGTRLTLSGGSAAVAPYVDLPNQLLSANSTNNGGSGAVTIEGWVKVTGVQNWSRIFDFGSMDIDQTAA
ncbi:MAG TPA: LamG-like jellyroll fold domain-containing protein, partial [Methylomirabilota bacterium]|nr:LamG-like jellyroll fold domain-containing protein [Methylomirabilota bacterium]